MSQLVKVKEEKNSDEETLREEIKQIIAVKQEDERSKVKGRKSEFREKDGKGERSEVKIFVCGDCGLSEEYNWHGRSPPFCRSVVFLDESYVSRDPFSANSSDNNANFLLLGSKCSLCSGMTCQQCSVFYTKRICKKCFTSVQNQLPQQLKVSANKKKEL